MLRLLLPTSRTQNQPAQPTFQTWVILILSLVEQILAQATNADHFQVKIHDIPLDLNKPLFLEFLNKIDKVTQIKYIV